MMNPPLRPWLFSDLGLLGPILVLPRVLRVDPGSAGDSLRTDSVIGVSNGISRLPPNRPP